VSNCVRADERHVLRRQKRDGELVWLLLCPGCGVWGTLDDDQFHGRISTDHATDGCTGGYHETHDFAALIDGRDMFDCDLEGNPR
jgi:hypothetical protein